MPCTLPVIDGNDTPGPLPPLVASWVKELLGGSLPTERNATCADCSMCRSPERTITAADVTFRPNVKCCSYTPNLPNFSVGAILRDASPDLRRGRQSVEARIDAKLGVGPLGIEAPPVYSALYHSSKERAFGKSRKLLCPHYIDESGGVCGIWQYRNAVCSTYHCKFVRGKVSKEFWARLEQLLREAEDGLARWCVLELGLELDALGHVVGTHPAARSTVGLTSNALDERAEASAYRRVWGERWFGRERSFFEEAASLVKGLRWSDVTEICGIRIMQYAALTRQAYRCLSDCSIPEQLALGQITVTLLRKSFVAIRSYSRIDQLVVHWRILSALAVFDGSRTTSEAVAVARSHGVSLPPAYIRQLVDFAVLVPTTNNGSNDKQGALPTSNPR